MEAEFIPYELALALKELGFDEPCLIKDTEQGEEFAVYYVHQNGRPTFLQAFRWFREKYQLHSTITSVSQESWQWHITKPGENLCKLYDDEFNTYEEAELECLRKLIEIVKNK
jgi:hypothetical protein